MSTQDDFIIPERFLKKLQEFSNGGFILLTFSAQGRVVVHTLYDSDKDRLALEAALGNWLDSVEIRRQNEENESESESEKQSG